MSNRREEMREKSRLRKQKEIEEFLNDVDKLHNNIDSIVHPSVHIMKEYDNNYTSYHVVSYPNCLVYKISLYKKEHPFNIYRSSEYYKNNIPKKYEEEFLKLEQYFK